MLHVTRGINYRIGFTLTKRIYVNDQFRSFAKHVIQQSLLECRTHGKFSKDELTVRTHSATNCYCNLFKIPELGQIKQFHTNPDVLQEHFH